MGIIKDFIKTAWQQLFFRELRDDKLMFTHKAYTKIVEWGLDTETLQHAYQTGERVAKGQGVFQITKAYQYYSVGLWFTEEYRPVKGTKQSETDARMDALAWLSKLLTANG